MQRSLEPKNGTDRQLTDRGELPVPTNPVIMATLRAIYAGGIETALAVEFLRTSLLPPRGT